MSDSGRALRPPFGGVPSWLQGGSSKRLRLMGTEVIGASSRRFGRAADYFALTKPTIALLVAVTVIPGLLLASWPSAPGLIEGLAAVLGASLASASAAVFNQLVESDLDTRMDRTRTRSVASGRVPRDIAFGFGLLLGVTGLMMLWAFAHWLAALVALCGHLFYVLAYTLWLKKRTEQNIVIGGAAGAVGPLIGWASIDGQLGWPAWILFLVIFLWTPPHFWALALKYEKDYRRAGIPMYPCVHGADKTRWAMFLYTLALIPCVLTVGLCSGVGLVYMVTAGLLTFRFCYDAWRLYRSGSNEGAMAFFHYSCFYVFGVFGFLSLDVLIRIGL